MAEEHQEEEPTLVNPEVHYERRDLNIYVLGIGIISLLILVWIGLGISNWTLGTMENQRSKEVPTPLPLTQLRPTPPAPRLQPSVIDRTTAEEDIATLRAREEEQLTTYGWVNRDAGIVRIPIDQAIEILAEDGSGEPAR